MIKNYNNYLEKIKEIEKKDNICPKCKSINTLTHVNPLGYDFMCSKCGNIIKIKK